MGVCTGDSKKKENKNIKIDDFYLSGILKGKKRKPEDPIEPPKEEDKSQNNKVDTNANPEKGEEKNKMEHDNNTIENEENKLDNIEPVTKKPEDEKNDDKDKNDKINYNIFIFQEDSQNPESKSKELEHNSKYENFDINKNYYLICPDCKFYITNINSVEFDNNTNDFKFKYKCLCELSETDYQEKYFHSIISENKLNCDEHNSELKYICENCKKQICIECKDTSHLEHEINTIINNEVITDSIMDNISDKKDIFKGFDLIEKIFNFYKNYESTPKLPENEIEVKEEKKSSKHSENISQKYKENEQELEKVSNNFINNRENLPEINDDNLGENNEENKNIIESENNKDKDKNTKEEINEERISQEENIKNSIKLDNPKKESNQSNQKKDEDLNNVENKIYTNTINENENDTNKLIENNNNDLIKDGDKKKLKNESDNTEVMNCFKKSFNFNINNDANNENINDKRNEIFNSNIKEKDIDKIKKVEININVNNSEVNQNKNNLFSKNDIKPYINEQNPQKILNQYKNIKTLKGHKNIIDTIIKLSSGYIATGSYDKTIRIWDITKNEEEALIDIKKSNGNIFCLLEIKPNLLYAGNSENKIDIYDLNEKKDDPDSSLIGHSLWVTSLVKCDEKYFASSSNDARIIIWDSDTNIKIRELLGHTDCILTMILLKNGYLCTGSADKNIRIWNWENGNCLFFFQAHDNWVKCLLQFNDEIFLSGSDDKTIKIWDMNLNILGVLKGHKHSVRTFCKIGENYFASGSFDKTIKIWDFKEKKCIQTLVGHESNVICILNDDGKLISCSRDNSIKIWEEI